MATTKTTWQIVIAGETPEHLLFATEAEAQAWIDKFLATDRRNWQPGDVRIAQRVETIVRKAASHGGWNPDRRDANSTAWARRGYGDGDI
jgi:hypothetical protein